MDPRKDFFKSTLMVRKDLTIIINENRDDELQDQLKAAKSIIEEIEEKGTPEEPNTKNFLNEFNNWKSIVSTNNNVGQRDSNVLQRDS